MPPTAHSDVEPADSLTVHMVANATARSGWNQFQQRDRVFRSVAFRSVRFDPHISMASVFQKDKGGCDKLANLPHNTVPVHADVAIRGT